MLNFGDIAIAQLCCGGTVFFSILLTRTGLQDGNYSVKPRDVWLSHISEEKVFFVC